jgi:hypothetical protein
MAFFVTWDISPGTFVTSVFLYNVGKQSDTEEKSHVLEALSTKDWGVG